MTTAILKNIPMSSTSGLSGAFAAREHGAWLLQNARDAQTFGFTNEATDIASEAMDFCLRGSARRIR